MLAKAQLHELYYWLILNRTVEDRLVSLYRTGSVVGGVYTSRGQEAISVGTAYALERQDWLAPMIRNLGALLVRGFTPADAIAQYMARGSSPTRGRDCNLHMGDLSRGVVAPISMLGALIPVMAGVALASKLTGKGIVALTYIGDGGTSTTDFHEGLNFASVQRVPMVLVIENNGWAYSTPTRRQTAVPEFINRARAYGIRGYQVDGNEVISVYDATRLALEHCRKGDGPVLIEAMTMRMRGHAEHDSAWYVPKDELEQWKDRDPIELFERHLFESGSITESERDNIVARVRNEVDRAVELTEQSSFPPEEIARGGVYHESN